MRISEISEISEINEARKNPELNPKTSINDIIITATENTSATVAGVKNLFVSFTEIDKLGIYPKSKYKTPLGIYSYPAEFVATRAEAGKPMDRTVPFVGEQPFVNLFDVTGVVINLTTMSDVEANSWYKKISKYWANVSGNDWKESVDYIDNIVQSAAQSANFKSYPGGQFWYVTRALAFELADRLQIGHHVAWNKIFRELGIDGCVDTGVGIIHTSEATQAVFFSISCIDTVHRVYNKYSPVAVSKGHALGDAALELTAPGITFDRKMYLISQNVEMINKLKPGKDRLEILKKLNYAFAYLKKPTIEEQEAMVIDNIDQIFESADQGNINAIDDSVIIKAIANAGMGTIGATLRLLKNVLTHYKRWTPAIHRACIAKAPKLFDKNGEFYNY